MLRRHPIAADELPSAGNSKPGGLVCFDRVKDFGHKFEEREGSFCESVTHMNSAVKNLFVRVLFVETSGSSMQDLDPFFFDFFCRFECSNLKIHSNSYKNRKIENEDFLESL